ncbi:MAG: sensor histidine kinase, partial [Spirochaetaceae bacterium]
KAQLLLFSGIFLAAMALLSIIVPFLTLQITQPIEELVVTSAEISAGLFHRRVVPRSRDEVGKLAAGFNTMAAEIERTIGLLNVQAEQKQRFIDNLTHELMNPLTTIIGYADFLMKKKKYEPQIFNRSLQYIYSEGKRIVELSDRLFDLMLLKNRKLMLEKDSVISILGEIRETLDIKMKQKDITLLVEGKDVMVPMERSLLKAAIVNLVDNAWKASSPGSRIIIGAGREHRAVLIYVQDFGRGIPASEMEKILEPFYQVEKAVTRDPSQKGEKKHRSGGSVTKGAGLGLSITAEILKLHGAKLVYESEEGIGTVAKIVF